MISLAQVPQEYHSFLLAAEENDVSSVLQTQTSIDIVKFYERHSSAGLTFDPKVQLMVGSLLREDKSEKELKDILDSALSVEKPCNSYDEYFSNIQDFPLQKMSAYPEVLQKNARTMKVGASKIVQITDEAVKIVTVCQKNKIDYYNDIPIAMRMNIQNRLKDHKLFKKKKNISDHFVKML